MNANDSEKVRIDEHASQVAQRAAEALRQSRMLRSRESIAVPTWTGRSGTAGAPGRKFGSTVNSKITTKTTKPEEASASGSGSSAFQVGALGGKALTSSELLAKIRGTREQAVSDATGVGAPRLGGSVQPEVLIRQICSFLQERGGVSDSGSIVEYFKDRIPSKDLPVFKSLLKEIATLQKNPNGSSWILKPEYQ